MEPEEEEYSSMDTEKDRCDLNQDMTVPLRPTTGSSLDENVMIDCVKSCKHSRAAS